MTNRDDDKKTRLTDKRHVDSIHDQNTSTHNRCRGRYCQEPKCCHAVRLSAVANETWLTATCKTMNWLSMLTTTLLDSRLPGTAAGIWRQQQRQKLDEDWLETGYLWSMLHWKWQASVKSIKYFLEPIPSGLNLVVAWQSVYRVIAVLHGRNVLCCISCVRCASIARWCCSRISCWWLSSSVWC